MKFFVYNNQGVLQFSNGNSVCLECQNQHKGENYCKLICPDDNLERRFGSKETNDCVLYLCSNQSVTKTTKLFKEKLEILAYTVPSMMHFKEEIEKTVEQNELEKYTKIVHNLKTLNAQSLMAQYNFISQDAFSEQYDNVLEYVINEVKNRPKEAAIAILRQAKNNAHMKTEFSSHEKMAMTKPVLMSRYHVVRTVVLNVYHSFDYDFKAKRVNLRIDNSDVKAFFDYETIRLALYHIFANAVKYICDNSILEVHLSESEESIILDFSMKSFYISPDEKDSLFDDHFSGAIVRRKNLNGSGLGMGLIKKALELNRGKVVVIPGEKRVNSDYSQNTFRFILPKKKS
jgi:light-regulated signal transduction histidine kinase (bacteriophytochrome)